MILTTTNSIEGYKIIDYLGIVTGVAINKEAVSWVLVMLNIIINSRKYRYC